MKDNKTSLLYRMEKRKAPKAHIVEVDALFNHIDELNGLVDTGLLIINSLQEERAELYRIIQNTARALESTWDDTHYTSAGVSSIVTQLEDLVTAALNDGVYHVD